MNVSDIVALKKYILLIPQGGIIDRRSADYNGDGIINTIDLCYLIKEILAKDEY